MTTHPGPPAPATPERPRRDLLRLYGVALVVGVFIVDGLLRTAYFYFGDLAEGGKASLLDPLIAEMTGSVAVGVGFFAVVVPWRGAIPCGERGGGATSPGT